MMERPDIEAMAKVSLRNTHHAGAQRKVVFAYIRHLEAAINKTLRGWGDSPKGAGDGLEATFFDGLDELNAIRERLPMPKGE